MIPKDELGPGAFEAGVPIFIDRQLNGDFGKAATWYMQGPWDTGLPTQGYQSRYTPAQMYRAAISAIDKATRNASNNVFAKLSGDDQDAFLWKRLASGDQQTRRRRFRRSLVQAVAAERDGGLLLRPALWRQS